MFLTVTHDENLVTNTKVVSSSNSSQSCTMIHLPLSHLYTSARQKNIVTKNPKQNCQIPLSSAHISGWCQSLMLCSVHISKWYHVINLKSNFSPCYVLSDAVQCALTLHVQSSQVYNVISNILLIQDSPQFSLQIFLVPESLRGGFHCV